MNHFFPTCLIFTILLLPFIPTYAASSEIQSVSHLDISQISGEKYVLEIDKHTFDIYYGFEGTIESSGNVLKPIIQSMSVNVEKKSIELMFEEVPLTDVFWIRLPTDLISAEKENYVVLIDGGEIQYQLIKYETDYAVDFILPADTKRVEIVGTYIIPEFSTLVFAVLAISIILITINSKKNRFRFTVS